MTTLADLKPGDRTMIYGDVEIEVLEVKDRTYPGDEVEWVSIYYRAITTGLKGAFVYPASTVVPLSEPE